MRQIWRALFWIMATIGRPLGGVPPRRITLWLARKAYEADNPKQHEFRWTRDRDDLEFLVHPHYVNDLDVIAFGSYDSSLQSFLRSRLRPGMLCVDVGANVGFVALHMARLVGPVGKVYAFEPVPFLFQKLAQHIVRNHLEESVEPRQCAVSDGSGRVLMHVCDEHERNQGLALLIGSATDQERGMEVDCTSLDDFAARERLERMDFVKVDVQGAEALVIEGARSCFERFGPDVVLEVSSGPSPLGKSAKRTIELMEKAGYAIFELTAGAIGRRLSSNALSEEFFALNVFCSKHR